MSIMSRGVLIKALRAWQRRPLLGAVLILSLLAALGWALLLVVVGDADSSVSSQTDAATPPRALLNRLWFDRMPKKRTEKIHFQIWLAGGIGLYEHGSAWRGDFDLFDFERQRDKVHVTFLQDGKKVSSSFTVKPCDEKPPFTLCLVFDSAVRGPKKLYAFGDTEDLARNIPWGRQLLQAARASANRR